MKAFFIVVASIGVYSPAFAQQWTGSANLDGEINRNGNIRTNGLSVGRYGGGIVGDQNPYNIYSSDGESHDILFYGSSAATLHLRLYDGDLKLGSNSTPTTILFNNGNATFGGQLGIGTAGPYYWSKLHVKSPGANPWSILSEAMSNDRVIGIGHDGSSGVIAVSSLATGGWSPLEFRTQNVARMTIGVDGNVGIGTTTPNSYKLAVEGKIGAREVNVTTGAWADHVFRRDYRLRPLSEVQQFIEQNQHLPDVPSEKEVLANGQNLGEMNAILLKKIEELTLYLIELKAENEQLSRRLNTIEKKEKSN
ncbi:MAG: hypothetical protein ACOYXA_09055 [Bacteroidota bacterium]